MENNLPENVQIPVQNGELSDKKIPLHEAVFAWIIFALSFVFTHFCVRYFGGVWGGIFWALFGISIIIFGKFKKIKFRALHLTIFGISELFCLVPIFSANGFICFLASTFSFVLDFYLLLIIGGAKPFGRHFVLDVLLSVFERPFEKFAAQPVAAFSVFKGKKRAKNFLYAVIGLLIAVPLTITVVYLLARSDVYFSSAVANIINIFPRFSFLYVVELFFAVPISMYLFGALNSVENQTKIYSENSPSYRIMPPVVAYFAVSPICVAYLVYTIIQIKNIAGIAENTLNYSEFARKGFFELCAISIINLCVIMIMQMFVKRLENDKMSVVTSVYTIMISVFTLGIIATALAKMFLYVGEFGMTLLRVYTSWFMILLALIFITLIIFRIREFPLWKALFFEFTIMFSVLCFGNFEGNIAAYNISAFRAGNIEKLDVSEFYELGYAAVRPASTLTSEELGVQYFELEKWFHSIDENDSFENKFAYFSIPRAQAMNFISRNFEEPDDLRFAVSIDDSAEKLINSVTANIYLGEVLKASASASPAAGGAFNDEDIVFDFPYAEIFGSGDVYPEADISVSFDVGNVSDLPLDERRFALSYPDVSNFGIVFDNDCLTVKKY